MNYLPSDEVAAIKKRIDHPIIDGDGHLLEYQPMVRDFVVEIAGEEVAQRFDMLATGERGGVVNMFVTCSQHARNMFVTCS